MRKKAAKKRVVKKKVVAKAATKKRVATGGGKPKAMKLPAGRKKDDLKRISGVGPKLEKTLNKLGIYYFKQIAGFSKSNVEWVDDYLSFKGRIGRENWIRQAKTLAKAK